MNFNSTAPKIPPKPVFQSLLHSTGDGKPATSRVTDFADALKGVKSNYTGSDNKPSDGLNRLLNGGSGLPGNYKRV